MSHSHQEHSHQHQANKKVLLICLLLTAGYMIAEVIGGILTNSLALLSDAGHMLSDTVSLGVGLAAFKFGEKAADLGKTYGYKRFEILAALFNGVTLIVISLYIFWEAYHRFLQPPAVAGSGMLTIAAIGMTVNLAVAWILMKGDTSGNLNLRAAFLHVLGDLLGSVGAIVAALLILFLGWDFADPAASVIVSVLILISGWRVMREAVHVLMEGTPKGVDLGKVVETIRSIDRVAEIHDLHVWSITSGKNALSCHVVLKGPIEFDDSQSILHQMEDKLADLGIGHTTIQVEDLNHLHDNALLCDMTGEEKNIPQHSHSH